MAELLFLQSRSKATAAEIAAEFEVSTKTARRDMEALSMAGIPVYPERGRHGGWRLLGGAKTNLTGLRSDEARALFLATAQIDQGQHPGLRSAMSKLTEALPAPLRSDVERMSHVVHVDSGRWGGSPTPGVDGEIMEALQTAVVERRQVRFGYRDPKGRKTVRTVSPLGLVAKAAVWYLVAMGETGRRTFRVDRVQSVELTAEASEVPDNFDLGAEWDDVRAAFGAVVGQFRAEVEAEERTLGILRFLFRGSFRMLDELPNGRFRVGVGGYGAFQVAAQLAGLVDSVTVVEPQEVKDELVKIGDRLVERYGPSA